MVCNTTLLHIHQQLKETFDITDQNFLLVQVLMLSVIYISYYQFKEN